MEIGGYLEFEHYYGNMLHDDGIKLNCGRNCLAYLIEANDIKSLLVPYYICDSVINVCKRYEVEIEFYHIGLDFKPQDVRKEFGNWLYLVNYFGQLSEDDILQFKNEFGNVIVDNTQAFFCEPVREVSTLYTCRKYFGVADGAILFSNSRLQREKDFDYDESYNHMIHLMGRLERSGAEFYSEMINNDKRFDEEPIKHMSKLTENILRSIDYNSVKKKRTENYLYLREKLDNRNLIYTKEIEGAFAYPFLMEKATQLRKKLIQKKIYIPTLWPYVLDNSEKKSIDHYLTSNILPIPCDQRYGLKEMKHIIETMNDCINGNEENG